MLLKRKIRFSVFQLDYELAPEFRWPSQIVRLGMLSYRRDIRRKRRWRRTSTSRAIRASTRAASALAATRLAATSSWAPCCTWRSRLPTSHYLRASASYRLCPACVFVRIAPLTVQAAFLMSPFCKLYSEARSRFVYADEDLIEHRYVRP